MIYIEVVSYRTTKSELFKYTKTLNYRAFSLRINTIIADLRGLPFDQVKNNRVVHTNETLAYLYSVGIPADGLQKVIKIPYCNIVKSDLFKRIPYIESDQYRNLIPAIKGNIRQGYSQKLKNSHGLWHDEILAFLHRIGEEPQVIKKDLFSSLPSAS